MSIQLALGARWLPWLCVADTGPLLPTRCCEPPGTGLSPLCDGAAATTGEHVGAAGSAPSPPAAPTDQPVVFAGKVV